jgi:hypothetical protein
MLWFLGFSIRYEKQLLEDVGRTMALVFFLVAITAGVRWKSHREAKSEEGEVRFEDALDPAVQELGLNRDGSWELGPPHNPKSYTQ